MLQFIPETKEPKSLIIRKGQNTDKAWEVTDKSVPYKAIQAKEENFIYIVKEKILRLWGRRRGWDGSREQHRNMYII